MSKYWLTLQKQYHQLVTRVNQVVPRERFLLLMGMLVVIYIFWSLLFMFPQRKAITLAKVEEAALVQQVAQFQQKIATIEKSAAQLPAEVQSSNTALDSGLVSIATAIPVFKSLATQQPGGVLKALINLPDQLLNLPGGETGIKLPVALYAQGVTVIFDSNYAATCEYLRSLENLKWMIFWDELQYIVTQYPGAEVKLTVHTISKGKED